MKLRLIPTKVVGLTWTRCDFVLVILKNWRLDKAIWNQFLGTCRALHPWIALDGSNYLGVGTHLKYYINEGGGYNDITPLRVTTAAGDVTFSASDNDLNGAIDAIQTTITLTSTSGFPTSGRIKIEDEIITYALVSGSTLTGCVRG